MILSVLLIVRRRPEVGAWVVPAAVLTGAATLVMGAMLLTHHASGADRQLAVVVEGRASLREGPHPDSRGVALPEGMEVRLVEQVHGWSRVELSNGRQGWVEGRSVEAL